MKHVLDSKFSDSKFLDSKPDSLFQPGDVTDFARTALRVPLGARTCSLNCPESTEGKKSWPSHG